MPPIQTQTFTKTVPIDPSVAQAINEECDIQGAGGFRLAAALVIDNEVLLIFQAASA